MAEVTYRGPYDVRELSAEDFRRSGVSSADKDRVFPRDEAVTITKAEAKLLAEHPAIFGRFDTDGDFEEKDEETLDIVTLAEGQPVDDQPAAAVADEPKASKR